MTPLAKYMEVLKKSEKFSIKCDGNCGLIIDRRKARALPRNGEKAGIDYFCGECYDKKISKRT